MIMMANEAFQKLMAKIKCFNACARQAEADGYVVWDGYVWEGWGNPTGPCARKVCRVEDYVTEEQQ